MEDLRMEPEFNYKFTALLIIMFIILTLFAKPAYPRNDYLNNGSNECRYGEMSALYLKMITNQNLIIVILPLQIVMIILMKIQVTMQV